MLAIAFTIFGLGPEGLGWAQSIGAILEVIILIFLLQVRSRGKLLNASFWGAFIRMLFASAIAGCVAYSMTKFFPLLSSDDSFFATFPKFFFIALISFIAYFIASYFLNLKEITPFIKKLKKIVFRNLQ